MEKYNTFGSAGVYYCSQCRTEHKRDHCIHTDIFKQFLRDGNSREHREKENTAP